MAKTFPILAIETSGELCSAAVMLEENSFIEMNILGKHVHSEKLLGMVEAVIKSSKIELKEFAQIAISIGPGSFTGLRIGLAAVKGLASGAKLPVVPVPTFDAFALELTANLNADVKFGVVKTASVDEFYFSSYVTDSSKFKKNVETRLISINDVEEISKGLDILYGDNQKNDKIKRIIGPKAVSIAKWSYLFGKDLLTFDCDYLEPYYLKQFIVKVKP